MSYVIHQWVMSHIKKNCWPHQWPTGKSHMSRMRMRMSQENWWPHHFGGGESRLGGGPVHCNMLQHAVTHCKTLQHTATHCSTLQYTAAHCNTLQKHCNTPQHTATYWWPHQWRRKESYSCAGPLHCNTLQHTTTHCNTLHHTATNCNKLQHIATHCNTPHPTCGPTSGVGKSRIQAQALFTDTNYFVVVCRVGNKIENVRKRGC